jgi:SAM-dependent methyltransferase
MIDPESAPVTAVTPEPSDYNQRYFQTGLGLPYDPSEPHWAEFFGEIADHLVEQLSPSTVLDAGCAKGFLVAALVERGVDATGIDVSEYAVGSAVEGARGRLHLGTLAEPLDGRWDLVTCIEVLEHMAPADTQRAIDNICAVTNRVLLSSTPHDFVEPSHVNVRPVATWVSWFATRGYFRRADLDLSYLSPWAVVFERRAMTPADVAYLYEVELAPMREELATKQGALLDADRRIGELLVELDEARQPEPEPEPEPIEVEPRYDIDRVLSLIDQVVGLQAEMAEERYRHDLALWAATVAADEQRKELESQALRAEERAAAAELRVTEVLTSRSWKAGQAIFRPASLLRRLARKKA